MSIVKITDFNHWIDMSLFSENKFISENCNIEKIQKFLDENVKVKDLRVTKAEINTKGNFTSPVITPGMMPATEYTGLPAFCDIHIEHCTGKHTENIILWIPLVWNERFFGCNGGGNRTIMWMPEFLGAGSRQISMPVALRNGYACACTDAACRSEQFFGWGVDHENKEFDYEMYFNWIDYSTHIMAVVGKSVTEFICNKPPKYSYTMGASGGGRQVAYSAQKYPQDYDGYWADCPVLTYQKMLPALAWPAVVMNEYNNAMHPAKFEAFREAVWEKAGGKDAFYETTDYIDFDAFSLIGKETPAGEITHTDAVVMHKIWEGARSPEGEFLWYGMRPGVTAWEANGYSAVAQKEDGSYKAVPFSLTVEYMRDWLLMDNSWEFESLTTEGFHKLFIKSCCDFSSMDLDNPDMRNLRDLGGKLILCHGVDDSAIYVDGTIDYYEKIMKVCGGREKTMEFARLFVIPGDDHASYAKFGCGPSNATAMAALTEWVEENKAPDFIRGQHFDKNTMSADREKNNPVY
ncbi:MAG: tannase/feruloyl esterase family alpha/beta hydrolase [Anaerofustis stercorihominis]|nr:tannase/feruloyl esterase family alpha/beta hydrolase [Anaerofustis stercorihominis]